MKTPDFMYFMKHEIFINQDKPFLTVFHPSFLKIQYNFLLSIIVYFSLYSFSFFVV